VTSFCTQKSAIEVYPTRENLASTLGITTRRLNEYIKLFNDLVPREFKYFPGQRVFTPRQVEALTTLRRWFSQGFIEPQIKQEIIKKGLPRL